VNGWRGLIGGALTLIALQAFISGKGPEQGGKLLTWAANGLRAVMSSEVAAIPQAKAATPAKQAKPAKPGTIAGPLGLGSNPPVVQV